MSAQKSPMWESGDEAWSEDESVSFNGSRESNVGNGALRVIGLYGLGDKISLFLKDWELAKVALSCFMAWTCCARKCMRPGGGLPTLRVRLSQHEKPFSHRGRAVTKRRGMW